MPWIDRVSEIMFCCCCCCGGVGRILVRDVFHWIRVAETSNFTVFWCLWCLWRSVSCPSSYSGTLMRNKSKMVPGGPQGPWRAPGMLPGPPGTEPDPFWRSGKKIEKKMSAQGAQQSQFWDPAGTPKSTKSRSLAQKVVPGSDFSCICFRGCRFSCFGARFLIDF